MQYPAILPSHASNNRFIIYYSDLDRQLLHMRSTKVVAVCIFNELLAAGLSLALDSTSTRIDPSTSGSTISQQIMPSSSIKLIRCFSSGYECIPIKAHAVVAMQHMPCGLSDTDHQIWENISHVALQEILLARIRGI